MGRCHVTTVIIVAVVVVAVVVVMVVVVMVVCVCRGGGGGGRCSLSRPCCRDSNVSSVLRGPLTSSRWIDRLSGSAEFAEFAEFAEVVAGLAALAPPMRSSSALFAPDGVVSINPVPARGPSFLVCFR